MVDGKTIGKVIFNGVEIEVLINKLESFRIDGNGGSDTIDLTPVDGIRAAINGGDGNDTLTGTQDVDVIDGGAGTDFMDGNEGDDSFLAATASSTKSSAAMAPTPRRATPTISWTRWRISITASLVNSVVGRLRCLFLRMRNAGVATSKNARAP